MKSKVLFILITVFSAATFQGGISHAGSPVDGTKVLIVTHRDLLPAATRLCSWKNSLGWNARVVTMDEVQRYVRRYFSYSLSSTDELVLYLYWEYHRQPSLAHVVILGDSIYVPTRYMSESRLTGTVLDEKYDTHETDLYYACLDGLRMYTDRRTGRLFLYPTNLVPDVGVGRLPAQNFGDALNIVEKIVYYERGQFESDAWIKRVSFIGSIDPNGNPLSEGELVGEGMHDYCIGRYFDRNDYDATAFTRSSESCDQFYLSNGLREDREMHGELTTAINAQNRGRSIVCVAEHGGLEGTEGANVELLEWGCLHNEGKYPFVILLSCAAGAFAPWSDRDLPYARLNTYFSEAALNTAGAGAIGILGASKITGGNNDEILEEEFFKQLFTAPERSESCRLLRSRPLGEIMVDTWLHICRRIYYGTDTDGRGWGDLKWGNPQVVYARFVETYNLLGDPTLRIWLGYPDGRDNHPPLIGIVPEPAAMPIPEWDLEGLTEAGDFLVVIGETRDWLAENYPDFVMDSIGVDSISFRVFAHDPEGDCIDLSCTLEEGEGRLEFNKFNGEVTFTPQYNAGEEWATARVKIAASDDGGMDTYYIRIKVQPGAGVFFLPGGLDIDIGGDSGVFGELAEIRVAGNYNDEVSADLAVFREGWWYVKDAEENWISDPEGVRCGENSDIPVPGDYNGDGVTDPAVFRPSEGLWYMKDIEGNWISCRHGVLCGISRDVPVPGDYNGDGVTDLAVFRKGVWFIKDAKGAWISNPSGVRCGSAGDTPVPGDYNGDGVTDLAVFREGVWYMKDAGGSWISDQGGVRCGGSGDIPVPGDYDGDGVTDLAVCRKGEWYIKDSEGNWISERNGVRCGARSGDIPVPGDYNGDGVTDLAVFRGGWWYIKDAEGNWISERNGVRCGQSGDIPAWVKTR